MVLVLWLRFEKAVRSRVGKDRFSDFQQEMRDWREAQSKQFSSIDTRLESLTRAIFDRNLRSHDR